jgi:hypothetical protein
MTNAPRKAFPARISLLEFLLDRGWKPLRDNGSDEVAGLCPLHRDTRPSFYVNRRKQVFYCHGCGWGGGLARLARLLGEVAEPVEGAPSEQLLADTYDFYRRQLVRSQDALGYLDNAASATAPSLSGWGSVMRPAPACAAIREGSAIPARNLPPVV